MTCAISWGRCSLIRLLVVMSIVVVLVLFISFPVDGGGCTKTSLRNYHLMLRKKSQKSAGLIYIAAEA